ncbi:MAG TPA: paraquat-inducible protein A [Tepidisphaeraceae bacterium]|nr:paraquat-inducible protein A [Tepidisphaeraceae bacterium]
MWKSGREIGCRVCGQVHAAERLDPGMVARCSRCGAVIARGIPNSLHLTAAFSIAALILYVPANLLPILRLDMYGATSQNTVWQGVQMLFQDGDVLVAVVVFLASIFIPLLKIFGLFFLVATTKWNVKRLKMSRIWVYRVIDAVGRWAMLDVFVLAVLVSLVKLGRLATIIPGQGLLAFALVVVFTLLASASFDPQLIWEKPEAGQ